MVFYNPRNLCALNPEETVEYFTNFNGNNNYCTEYAGSLIFESIRSRISVIIQKIFKIHYFLFSLKIKL